VSSGFLRRRDNRVSGAGVQEATGSSSGRDSFGGEPGALVQPSRGSAAGRVPLHVQHSTHLIINSSVTVMRLSESSSTDAHPALAHQHSSALAAAATGPGVPAGTTMTLQQYQHMQQAQQCSRAAARSRWWRPFWQGREDSLTLAAKKRDSMVAAAAAAGGGAGASLAAAAGARPQHQQQQQQQQQQDAGVLGGLPLVLDAGVLQEEQRIKAALFAGAAVVRRGVLLL
jgi:hypothetical protein